MLCGDDSQVKHAKHARTRLRHDHGYAERFGAQIVNYADDLVICCRRQAEEALQAMRQMMVRLKLTALTAGGRPAAAQSGRY